MKQLKQQQQRQQLLDLWLEAELQAQQHRVTKVLQRSRVHGLAQLWGLGQVAVQG